MHVGVPVTDHQKLYHLQEKLEHDARFSVLSIMASSKTSHATYEDTIKYLVLLDPAPAVAHKMASLTPTIELCRRHIAGLCTNGSSCKYSQAREHHLTRSPTRTHLLSRKIIRLHRNFPSRNRSLCQIPIDHLLDIPKELHRRRTQLDTR